MKKFLRCIFLFALIFCCKTGFTQNTIIHDIPWESDTVGIWGSGSTAWSINQIDTLVDFTIGPYAGNYSYTYYIPYPIDNTVGVIFDYGAYVDMQMVFEMVGWTNGSCKVDYPTRIKMDFPPNGSFANGDWVTIPSEYREQDTAVHPTTDTQNWDIYANWPDAGKIELFVNLEVQANLDLIYSDITDPTNIVWDTLNLIQPVNIDLDTFDIFLIDLINNQYTIPWVAYHTDPLTGSIVIDSVYLIHDSIGMPIQFPAIFYNLIGISGSISIPNITNYVKSIENEQRLYTKGSDQFLFINLDIVKFVQVMCHYLSSIPSFQGLEAVSQAMSYMQGDTTVYLFTDPITGDPFNFGLHWDLLEADLLFNNSINQILSFEDTKEYSILGIPIPPKHYPNVWNIFEFPVAVDYEVLDTLGVVIQSGTADSVKFGSDYDLRLRYPCYDYDSLPITISHTIDPWLTNNVYDSTDVSLYIKVLDIGFYLGTLANPIYSFNYILYQDTLHLGSFSTPPIFGPPIFMPWLIDGYFNDTTFIPNKYIVPINNPLRDSLAYTNILCFGNSTGNATVFALGGVPPYTYQWSNGTSIISTDTTISNLSAGTYYVTVTDGNGCDMTDSVTLISNPPIVVTHTYVDVFCQGTPTGSVTLSVIGGVPPYHYIWSPNVGTASTIVNLYAGTYYVTVQDNVGCTATDSVTLIYIHPSPIVNFTGEPLSGCPPLTVQFTNLITEPNGTYLWDFGDGTPTSNFQNPDHIYNSIGAFPVSLQVTSQFGCETKLSIPHMVDVWPFPYVYFSSMPSPATTLDPQIFFYNSSSTTYNCFWNFGDGSTSTEVNPYHTYPAVADSFNVMLIVASNHGCTDTAWGHVYISEITTFYIPNAFTPNEDGKNDVFKPEATFIEPNSFEMFIYDRWGKLLFESHDINEGWDGTVNGNLITDTGIFNYLINYRDITGKSIQRTGQVVLIQ